MASPYITKHALEDGSMAWSLYPEVDSFFSHSLRPQTAEELGATALKVICFACPPCYEGNTTWSAPQKKAIWPLLERATMTNKVQAPLRSHVLETYLYFCERDSVAIRRMAVDRAWTFLRKSMPYYLHASVVLFQSILDRLDGELARSNAQICDFLGQGLKPLTRRDHALQGRLHISQIENKIKSYDNDVPSFIYKWKAAQPLSSLDIEITSRLQGVAARFFQSVGDFVAARASLEQFLSLYTTNSIRVNTRRLIVGRLADIYCEMQEYSKVAEILQPEFDSIDECDRLRRPFRRLLLASVEANIGFGKLDVAESALRELDVAMPFELDDLYDQQLHMRRLLAGARIAHMRHDYDEAVRRWKSALQEVERMHTLKPKGCFTAAMIHLSLAHAQLISGDRDKGQQSWFAGMEILRTEKCEFWIPIVPTVWLRKIVTEVHKGQGWPFRMMLPGGKADFTWP
ncbi:major facilitator superfamily [Elasticomyces elasticus]|uniref:Major facilitator superfamily n=1 Tax=Exophiala sideris TaxID=1016849 RepID=A0ABR0JH25_9EURO|nr:major facilitator superfamily [Elasticomyces elasticus]KAK5033469.1 major facilitator superfamily [Exophiala sideris]KAK5042036.1 major facilitator superfamily [Exophiala sideris]KAK5064013.1 major facilitator superfamily [Exophiala sideris]KAK5185304.1 major facilitator superfamily [Eurotiomycetes sp. CCFEE 6388]